MKNYQEQLTALIYKLFPDQVKVYDITCLNEKTNDTSMLHQHFFELLSENEQQELVRQIAVFLNKQSKETIYSFFWGNCKTVNLEAKWYVSSVRLKKCTNSSSLCKVVVFTYDLEALGENKAKLYQVIESLVFLKNNYNTASLLTKREIEILGLLALGKKSVEIGEQLYISEHTVNTHRKNINKKLEIKNLTDLMKYAAVFDIPLP